MNEGTPKSIVVTSLRAENVPAEVHFYQDILGLKLRSHQPGERPHLEIGGVLLVIQPGKPQPDSDEHFPVFAFAVEDLQSAVANLQAHQIHLP